MTMILQPPLADGQTTSRRERILIFGAAGVGKSYAWQLVLAHTPDDVTFHVVDTDGAWEPAAASPEFAPHAHRVRHHEPIDWPEYIEAMKAARKEMLPNKDRVSKDWLVVDLGDKAWAAAQDYYSDRKFAGDPDSEDFFAALVDGEADDEDVMAKWGTINKLYAPFAEALVRCPGNVVVCATQKDLKKDKKGNYFRESKESVRDFGGVGAKPGGQKNLPHDLNTVLHLTGSAKGKRYMTRIKDRNREEAWGELTRPNEHFVMDFLMGVAGWVPAGK